MIADETYAVDALVDLAPNVPTNDLDDGKGGGFGGGHAAPPPQNGKLISRIFLFCLFSSFKKKLCTYTL